VPLYEYRCAECGDFAAMRSMARYQEPAACPACGASSPRVLISAPSLASMSGVLRKSIEVNERSVHAPRSSSGGHGMSCSCCKTGSKAGSLPSRTVKGADGSKRFPSARPWMISH